MMVRAYVGLGSNIGDPQHQMDAAIAAIAQIPHTTLIQCSQYYVTKPWGDVPNQPDFLNAVVALDTTLPALDLLQALQAIEQQQGRVRTLKNGPRTIDCDVLLYGEDHITLPTLTVPHPCMYERAFVLVPLADIAPHLILPNGHKVTEQRDQCL